MSCPRDSIKKPRKDRTFSKGGGSAEESDQSDYEKHGDANGNEDGAGTGRSPAEGVSENTSITISKRWSQSRL